MLRFRRLLFVVLSLSFVFVSASSFGQTNVSLGEKKLFKKLERNFKRYHKNLQFDLADYEFLQSQLKVAKDDKKLRLVLIEDYEDYLHDRVSDASYESLGSPERSKVTELIKELNHKRRSNEGQLFLLDRYSEELSASLVLQLDGFYRQMILEIESYGHYEISRALMESKKEINPVEITEAMNQLLSRENLSFTREILNKKIQDAGGFKKFRKAMRAERRKNLKWGCVSLKILAGTALLPFSYAAMQFGVMIAPMFLGQINLVTTGALVGSLGSFTVSAMSVKKLITGCHREVSTFNGIDGFVSRE